MENYLWRFLVKCKGWILVGFILASLGGFFYLAVNQIVTKFIPSLVALTTDRLKIKVSFRNVRYGFPHQIIIKQLKIFDMQAPEKSVVEVPLVKLDFVFSSQEKVHLTQIELNNTILRVPALKNYLTHNGSLLWAELRALPSSDIKISLIDAHMYLFKDNQIVSPLVFNMDFKLSKGTFVAKIKDRYSFLQWWGHWQKDRLNWNGFMFYNGPLAKEPLYILDINGKASIKNNDISLENLSFSVNGDRFLVSGHYLLDKPYTFETSASYIKQFDHISSQDPLNNLEIKLHGQAAPNNVLVNGHMNFDLFSDADLNMPLQRVNLEFQDLQTRVINDKLLQLKIGHTQGLLWTNSEHKISFDNFLASINRGTNAQFIATLSTQLYGGRYQGRILLDTISQPWQVDSHGKLEEIDVNRLSEVLFYFNKCRGYLSGNFDIQAPHHLSLSGTLLMHEGDFSDFSFLPMAVSKIFQMPSLDHLSETNLFVRFKFDKEAADIENFRLHSNNVNLDGSFRLDSNHLVSSQVSILFSKDVFNESPIGQKIIQLVPRAWQMPFEFRLSGNFQKMNFQWDNSLLKRKIEQRLPHFVERSIERNIDEKAAI